MKSTIFSILILATLLVWFCFFGENIPYKSKKEGWAFSDGESGTPIPKDGADGKMNVFTISNSEQAEPEAQQQTTTAQGKTDFPISVSVEKQTAEKPHQTQEWEIFLIGVGVGALVAEIVILIPIAIYYIKRRIRHEKRKTRTHKTHRVP